MYTLYAISELILLTFKDNMPDAITGRLSQGPANIRSGLSFDLTKTSILVEIPYCGYPQPAKKMTIKTLAQQLWITLHNPWYFFLHCG